MTKALRFLAALLVAFPAFAQAQRTYSQPELDQMLAPVALYPDPLLSQLLMAATHPVDVIEAARWSRANPGLQGDDAVRAVAHEDWHPSVKSLVAFPQILARMDENLDWTRRLGEAFRAQEPQVMDAVQQLRRKAQAAGNLASSEQFHVQQQGQTIVVQPASPQFVYVPYYDPFIVYGPWWLPAYQPVYWAPWPRPVVIKRTIVVTPHRWQHEPQRRDVRVIEPPRRVVVTSVPEAAPAARAAPVASPAAVAAPVRVEARARPQPLPQIRQEQRARMPEAVAPQQPRAQRHEPPHAPRGEQRNEHRPRGRERS